VFGLAALPRARLIFRFSANPRQFSMNGARQAGNIDSGVDDELD
jgi:hypothetical protein